MRDDARNRLIGIDNLWLVRVWTLFELERTVGKCNRIFCGDLSGSEIHHRCDAGCGLCLFDEDSGLCGNRWLDDGLDHWLTDFWLRGISGVEDAGIDEVLKRLGLCNEINAHNQPDNPVNDEGYDKRLRRSFHALHLNPHFLAK